MCSLEIVPLRNSQIIQDYASSSSADDAGIEQLSYSTGEKCEITLYYHR